MAKPVIKRRGAEEAADKSGLYFTSPKNHIDFINSGAQILDCVVGGGWPLCRLVNIVGDKSTGKTLLAIEAIANFERQYPDGLTAYAEAEAAFDDNYAMALGVDMTKVRRPEVSTVEELFDSLQRFIQLVGPDGCGLYVVDSLDALSDKAEQERKISDSTYGASKPKQLGQLFRRLIKPLEKSKVCVIIISQTRDNIGVTFGEKHTRSGGRALDFYASIILWLAHLGQIKRQIGGITRPVGIQVKAKCKKNKIGLPFRECSFDIIFGYGIDDISSNLDFLKSIKRIHKVDGKYIDSGLQFRQLLENAGPKYKAHLINDLNSAVMKAWFSVEKTFLPPRGKYSDERD
jgi:recombination protein RecA